MVTKVDASVVGDQVFGRRNILINGNFNIYQRAQQVADLGASSGYFTADRWRTNFTTSGRLTMTAGTADAPAESNSSTSLKLDCTTADTSIASSENLILQQLIEGFNLQHVKKGTSGAKQLTVSFWVKGNGNATYVVELYDNDNARQISKSFSVTSSWSKVELTFPADTTGAFDNDANVSLYCQIWLHAGSTFTSGTLNSSAFAANNNANRAVGISSFFSSTDNLFYITDVQLEVGDTATPFEHRSFGEELELCKRYYQLNTPNAGRSNSTTSVRFQVTGTTEMRTTPSLALVDGTNKTEDYAVANRNITAVGSIAGGTTLGGLSDVTTSSTTSGKVQALLGGAISLDAEL